MSRPFTLLSANCSVCIFPHYLLKHFTGNSFKHEIESNPWEKIASFYASLKHWNINMHIVSIYLKRVLMKLPIYCTYVYRLFVSILVLKGILYDVSCPVHNTRYCLLTMRRWVHLFSIVAGETKWRIVMSTRDNNIIDRARLGHI